MRLHKVLVALLFWNLGYVTGSERLSFPLYSPIDYGNYYILAIVLRKTAKMQRPVTEKVQRKRQLP